MGFLCIGGKIIVCQIDVLCNSHLINKVVRISHVQSIFRKSRLLRIQGHASCEEGGCDRSHSPLKACQHDIDQSIALQTIESSFISFHIPAATSAGMTSWMWGEGRGEKRWRLSEVEAAKSGGSQGGNSSARRNSENSVIARPSSLQTSSRLLSFLVVLSGGFLFYVFLNG